MYSLIYNIISHVWQSGTGSTANTTEQTIIYYVCGMIIIIVFITVIDLIYKVFHSFVK